MFSFICGEVCGAGNGAIILKNNDIGYQILVSDITLIDCGTIGNKLQLFTYFQVSENGVALYGFKTETEKELFLKLISVSGVGPKLALAVLSGFKTERLLSAIISGDTATLSSIKGVGKKTSERIVLELREKISASELLLSREQNSVAGAAPSSIGSDIRDAAEALVLLGIPRAAADKLCSAAAEEGHSATEDIIKAALKKI